MDPAVRFFKTLPKTDGRFPTESFADQGVVAISAAYSLRCIKLVPAVELHAGDVLDKIDELVDANELCTADVERLLDLTPTSGARYPGGSRRCT